MAWSLAPALVQLRKEINTEWPNRDKSLDGTVGDTAHAARKSEHNPNRDPKDNVPDGYVTAMDIDKDGITANAVVKKLIADPRTWYVIHKGVIWSRTYGFKARRYTGPNAHDGHIHVSLVQSKSACNSVKQWLKATAKPAIPAPVQAIGDKASNTPIAFPGRNQFRINERSRHVAMLDEWLVVLGFTKHKQGEAYEPGPLFTSYTKANVKDFQRAQGWDGPGAHGDVGPTTWDRMQALARRRGWKS